MLDPVSVIREVEEYHIVFEHVPEQVHAGADVGHGDVGDVENSLVDQVITSPVMNTNNSNIAGYQTVLLCSLSILLEPLEIKQINESMFHLRPLPFVSVPLFFFWHPVNIFL